MVTAKTAKNNVQLIMKSEIPKEFLKQKGLSKKLINPSILIFILKLQGVFP